MFEPFEEAIVDTPPPSPPPPLPEPEDAMMTLQQQALEGLLALVLPEYVPTA